jgi:methionyl-tRNA synthetase
VFHVSETNREKVRGWAESETAVVPISAQKKVLDDLERQNSEISISRPKDRLHWGIPVPGD